MGESLRSVCRDPEMPSPETVYRWFRLYPEFRDQYARAKEDSADSHEDMIIDISDNPQGQPVIDDDGKPLLDADGNVVTVINNVAIQHASLRVNSRKWAASKLKPKKFGEKVQQDNTHSYDLSNLSDEELHAIAGTIPRS